ncbi:glutathione S-transferase family protein [Hydrogenophaga sp. R2]|uniref:glutathione S-transferase family protein n=1 Tax=Hydrogenophaga sp. R2 TaxID=3132827 RepID=UPI003CF5BB25
MIHLYDVELSGNCYKVRLLAALAGIPLALCPVDLAAGEQLSEPFRAMNPWRQVPLLVDDGLVLRDSHAILVYLAARHAPAGWWPADAASQARIVQWLSTSAGEIQHGPASARLVEKFGYQLDHAEAVRRSAVVLPLIDDHLASRDWLELDRPTVADCALFPYIAWAPEGRIGLEPYPAIRAWIDRIKALPGFLTAPGI